MTIYQDRHGTVSIDGHRAYIEAIEQQDARLEATMTEIRRRHDSGELYGAASAIERAEALRLTCSGARSCAGRTWGATDMNWKWLGLAAAIALGVATLFAGRLPYAVIATVVFYLPLLGVLGVVGGFGYCAVRGVRRR